MIDINPIIFADIEDHIVDMTDIDVWYWWYWYSKPLASTNIDTEILNHAYNPW